MTLLSVTQTQFFIRNNWIVHRNTFQSVFVAKLAFPAQIVLSIKHISGKIISSV